ncbi:MAG: DUF2277 domain-containing protein [Acidiferrobacterales bacterium]|nr:DUF2277 domain-containing protein [Acidiferrobacterales bacterium]
MCRNIKQLANFEPPATPQEIHAASLQFVRKVSGFTKPSKVNEKVFEETVQSVGHCIETLLRTLEIQSPPRNREVVEMRARKNAALRKSSSTSLI